KRSGADARATAGDARSGFVGHGRRYRPRTASAVAACKPLSAGWSMRRAGVLLADDNAIVAEGVALLLRVGFELVATVHDGSALIETALKLRPDIIVSDIAMPVLSGLEALARLREETSEVKVVFLTMHADAQLAAQALRAGVSGYVLKHSAGEEL